MKTPFINEDPKKQTQAVLKSTGLDNIRVHYINGCSSSRILTPPKEKQSFPDPCDTCGSSTRTNQCLTINCVYKIKCSHCDTVHIGETSRTIGSRRKGHVRMAKQTVYSHLINHNKPSMQDTVPLKSKLPPSRETLIASRATGIA